MIEFNESSLNNQSKKGSKKKIFIIILSIAIPLLVIVLIIILVIKLSNKKSNKNSESSQSHNEEEDIIYIYNLSTFFFFDPVTNLPCNQKNYWTQFDNETSCYRWISITNPDTNTSSTIKLMLDHNIATSTFIDYQNILNQKTKNWVGYNNIIDIIDEETIYNLM